MVASMKEKRTPHWVYVRHFNDEEWVLRIFVKKESGVHRCVCSGSEKKYIEGSEYSSVGWNYMKEKDAVIKLFRQKIFLEDL